VTAPRDWAAEALERWPGCEAEVIGGALCVDITGEHDEDSREASPLNNGTRRPPGVVAGFYSHPNGFGLTPIAAIEAAIRAEQEDARATLERLKVWNVP